MARILDESLPFGLATPELMAGDDEIMPHAEALNDGREPPPRLWPPVEVQDDEIASHLEEMLFTHRHGKAKGRRPVRH